MRVLGVFEDAAQRDFNRGLVASFARANRIAVEIDARLTSGCNFSFLADHVSECGSYDALLVGVDGTGNELPRRRVRRRLEKIELLADGLRRLDGGQFPRTTMWAIAVPSIEEWMLADRQALRSGLAVGLGQTANVLRSWPGGSRTEQVAKERLRSTVQSMVGYPLLRSGLEYAEVVGAHVQRGALASTRNPDLIQFLDNDLPQLLK